MRTILIVCVSALLISSCTWSNKKDIAVSPYPSVPLSGSTEIVSPTQVPSGSSYISKGTEPFWSVAVKPWSTTFSRPWEKGVTETIFKTTEEDKWSIVIIKSVKGDFFLNMVKWACSDGMSETLYEYNTTVLIGAESLTGCAMKVQ